MIPTVPALIGLAISQRLVFGLIMGVVVSLLLLIRDSMPAALAWRDSKTTPPWDVGILYGWSQTGSGVRPAGPSRRLGNYEGQGVTPLPGRQRHDDDQRVMARWRQGVEAQDSNLQQLNTMVDQMWDCLDEMPAWACRNVGLGKPSTSHDAVIQLSLHQLNELSDTDSITALNDLFRKDYGAWHPGAPKALIPPNTLVFVSWLRAYWPGEVEELIAQFLQSQAL